MDLINAPYRPEYGFLFYTKAAHNLGKNELSGPIGGTSGNITGLIKYNYTYAVDFLNHGSSVRETAYNIVELEAEKLFNLNLQQQSDGRYKVTGNAPCCQFTNPPDDFLLNELKKHHPNAKEILKIYAPSVGHGDYQVRLYDPLPALKIKTLGTIDIVDWNNDSYYLEIDKTRTTDFINMKRGYMKDNHYLQFFIIDGLPPNKYYALIGYEGSVIHNARTDNSGKIEIDIRDIPTQYREQTGRLVIYDKFTEWTSSDPIRSSTHVPFFDIYNENAFPLAKSASFLPTDSIYTPSAYVKFPVPTEIVNHKHDHGRGTTPIH